MLMRSGIAFMTGAACVLLGTGAARADRHAHAQMVFATSCVRCHSAESLRPGAKAGREQATAAKVDQPAQRLRAWLENPASVDPASLCHAGQLDPVQRELVFNFLRAADPTVRSTERAQLPPLAHHGLAPAPEHPGPKLGQGDHR